MTTRKTSDALRRCRGLTLIEVTLATVVAGIALAAAMTAISQAAVYKVSADSDTTTAVELANGLHVLALTLPKDTWDGSKATSSVDLDTFEDLTGATFSPPITANRVVHADLSDWSQAVTLSKVALDDPSRAAIDSDGKRTLWQMRIVVSEGAEVKGDFSWWIEP
jgi:prepilin-type N-terminal cleavage/methylation domain-containing protein